MSVYLEPVRIALVLFPFIALGLTVPYLAYDYHKHGSVSKWRGFVIYSFVFYLLCAYFLVILPLPDRSSVNTNMRDMIQIVPFTFVRDFLNETRMEWGVWSSILPGLKQGVVTQPLFNIVLTIPFGVYLRYYFNFSFKKTLLYTFVLTLFFEITQLTGLYGIYRGPYRLFDVDDLMLNTLGGVIGYLIAPAMTFFFPTRTALDEISYEKSSNVSVLRRLIAYSIDLFIFGIASDVMKTAVLAVFSTSKYTNLYVQIVIFVIFILYFAIVPFMYSGATLGMKLVKIRIIGVVKDATLKQLLSRTVVFYLLIFKFGEIMSMIMKYFGAGQDDLALASTIIYLVITLGYFLFMFIHFVSVSLKPKKRFFYEVISDTEISSTFRKEQDN